MKRSFYLFLFLFTACSSFAQNYRWAWIGGEKYNSLSGIYGTKGVPDAGNRPGARYNGLMWMDGGGNTWLFGGEGNAASGNGLLNDLWKYTPSNGQWNWVSGANLTAQLTVYGTKGVASAASVPGSRYGANNWIDASGNLWLFGGQVTNGPYGSNSMNDVWKFSPSTGQWTWVAGANASNTGVYGTKGVAAAANTPGVRESATGWVDASGSYWLFGGDGVGESSYGTLNDLWKFTPSSGMWTWVSGDKAPSVAGVYGTKGTAAAGNKPGGRVNASAGVDASGNFWLFGGRAITPSGTGSLNDLWKFSPATGWWTWVSGDNTPYQPGIYGTRGTAAAGNTPGARENNSFVPDATGNLWLFGGQGIASVDEGYLNDLWKFNTSTNQWTWVSGDNAASQPGIYGTKGVSAAANKPGARQSMTCRMDASGQLWFFGGMGFFATSSGYLNDLWKFNTSTNQWTWVSGDSKEYKLGVYDTKGVPSVNNLPAGRYGSANFADASGNLWVFGGNGVTTEEEGSLNDLWKLNTATREWTWVSGNNIGYQDGVYGTKGTANALNTPGSREQSASWTDASGNLWMLGGVGQTTDGNSGFLNDLWKFTPSNGLWTWINGDNTPDQAGIYGTRGTAAAGNKPGGRYAAMEWSGASGLWLFGGQGYASTTETMGNMNDLWRFNTSTNQWVWVSGDNFNGASGVYGTKGVANSANKPGARFGGSTCTDASGNFWLYGGRGNAATTEGSLNDLWKYSPTSGLWTWVAGDNEADQGGIYGTKGVAAAGNKPAPRTNASVWMNETGKLILFGGEGAVNFDNGNFNDLWSFDPATGLWTWMMGDNTLNGAGVYGTKYSLNAANKPGARAYASTFVNPTGQAWLYGGMGSDAQGNENYLNDLWTLSTAATLPAKFSGFTAAKSNGTVVLQWTTASEQNSHLFVIERSRDGNLYESIGAVAASGTTTSTSAYRHIDTKPLEGISYYRIKQVDFDNRSLYSTVRKVLFNEAEFSFNIRENPVATDLKVDLQLAKAEKLTIEVRDGTGHVLSHSEQSFPQGASVYSLPVNRLSAGTYYVRVISPDLNTTKVFLKR